MIFFFQLYSENSCITALVRNRRTKIYIFSIQSRDTYYKVYIIPCLLDNNFFQSSLFAQETLTTLYRRWSKENFKLVFETRVEDPDQFFKTDFISVFRLNIPV